MPVFIRLAPTGIAAPGAPMLSAAPAGPADSIRPYTPHRDTAELEDLCAFSNTSQYDGKSGMIAIASFPVGHPQGTLPWDTGTDPGFARSAQSEPQEAHFIGRAHREGSGERTGA